MSGTRQESISVDRDQETKYCSRTDLYVGEKTGIDSVTFLNITQLGFLEQILCCGLATCIYENYLAEGSSLAQRLASGLETLDS